MKPPVLAPTAVHSSNRRSSFVASIKTQMQARGLRSVPLAERVGYRYFDDHEVNAGDIGWLAIEVAGEVFGLDADMQIGLPRFGIDALRKIESCILWRRGTAVHRFCE